MFLGVKPHEVDHCGNSCVVWAPSRRTPPFSTVLRGRQSSRETLRYIFFFYDSAWIVCHGHLPHRKYRGSHKRSFTARSYGGHISLKVLRQMSSLTRSSEYPTPRNRSHRLGLYRRVLPRHNPLRYCVCVVDFPAFNSCAFEKTRTSLKKYFEVWPPLKNYRPCVKAFFSFVKCPNKKMAFHVVILW